MSLRINNDSSLFGLGRLNKTHSTLSKSLEKLATGRRINRAADDASGMAIADSLESQRRGYIQAIRNATDAISIVQTADGAIGEMTNILHEMRTKAIQAASDSQSFASRQALQADINRQLEGLNNIARDTSFNGQKLLSGQFTGKSFQVGAVSGETITVSISDISLNKLGTRSTSSEYQVSTTELTADLTTQSDYTTSVESHIETGSLLKSQTELATGSSVGFTLDSTNLENDITTTTASTLRAGSTLGAGSILASGTELGGSATLSGDVATTRESAITSGSTLSSGTVIASGTELQQDITAGGTTYYAGDTLISDITLTQDETLTAEMDLAAGSSIASGSVLTAGSSAGGDLTLAGTATISTQAVLQSGSTITDTAGTNIQAGSTIGGDLTLAADTSAISGMALASGSSVEVGSTLRSGSTIGGPAVTDAAHTLGADMVLGAGSILEPGSIIKEGTLLANNIRIAGGDVLEAGTVLSSVVVTQGQNYLAADQTLAAGSTLTTGSTIAPQATPDSIAGDSNKPLASAGLADIDVTTFEGAQAAIGAIDKALSQLNQARSGLGSTQNQLVSSIANLSVTMTNTAAAQSTIADLDFAEESINLNTFQVLLKAQVFAQAQTDRIKGSNIMNLLQG